MRPYFATASLTLPYSIAAELVLSFSITSELMRPSTWKGFPPTVWGVECVAIPAAKGLVTLTVLIINNSHHTKIMNKVASLLPPIGQNGK